MIKLADLIGVGDDRGDHMTLLVVEFKHGVARYRLSMELLFILISVISVININSLFFHLFIE